MSTELGKKWWSGNRRRRSKVLGMEDVGSELVDGFPGPKKILRRMEMSNKIGGENKT